MKEIALAGLMSPLSISVVLLYNGHFHNKQHGRGGPYQINSIKLGFMRN